MTLALYFDHNVDRRIVLGLRRRGVDVLTALEDNAPTRPDEHLLERATQLSRVLVSEDSDLLAIAHRWLRMGQHFAGLVRTPQKGISVGQAIHDLEILAKVMEPEEFIDRIEFLPL